MDINLNIVHFYTAWSPIKETIIKVKKTAQYTGTKSEIDNIAMYQDATCKWCGARRVRKVATLK